MNSMPIEQIEADCPHCDEPSLTLTFEMEGNCTDIEQRCDCYLTEVDRDNVVDEGWAELQDVSYPGLRD